ncbi:NTF2-like protein [Daedalea quercina L-15889]|uniref:NTF2-like protein n=1 Tax=Daedalea quercina L-15889 TaxID=1314783 RepID=A0A165T9X3_9APHY|nr:NTF2-like protein [Daedalea quercina L-15889]
MPASGSRNIAANAFRSAGILDRDERMRDVSDKPGGRKGTHKTSHKSRTSHRPRAIDAVTGKDQAATSSRTAMLASRLAAGDSLAIRGAAKGLLGRLRRNAVSTGATAEASSGIVEKWREFVKRRWNAEAKFLNLERVAEDEYVQRHKMWAPGSVEKELSVMFKLASVLFPEVQTISLAYNNIMSGRALSRLSHYLPNLANLSLQGNKLMTWRDLEYISGRKGKLSQLRELILLENPIRNMEYEHNRGDRYKSEVARRLPSLEMLDMEPIPKIAFDVPQTSTSHTAPAGPAPTTFPAEMGESFITGVDGGLLSGFLMRFFPLFDNQRSALMDVYHPNATFSFSSNTSIPIRARIEGHRYSKEMPHQRDQDWTRWGIGKAGGSRNLIRLAGGSVNKLVSSLHVGNEEIVKAMAELPTTKHDVAGTPERFCIDAWPVQQGDSPQLFVTIHGQFEEEPSRCVMSFDRSFILAPVPEGSRAKQGGWDLVILSDMLVVRQYSSHEAWRPGPMRVQAGDPLPPRVVGTSTNPQLTASQQDMLASMPEPPRSLVMQICQRTGLNIEYAVQCLEGNAWDVERAVANFEQVKGTLSREAFL